MTENRCDLSYLLRLNKLLPNGYVFYLEYRGEVCVNYGSPLKHEPAFDIYIKHDGEEKIVRAQCILSELEEDMTWAANNFNLKLAGEAAAKKFNTLTSYGVA
mgnify:FL=1